MNNQIIFFAYTPRSHIKSCLITQLSFLDEAQLIKSIEKSYNMHKKLIFKILFNPTLKNTYLIKKYKTYNYIYFYY